MRLKCSSSNTFSVNSFSASVVFSYFWYERKSCLRRSFESFASITRRTKSTAGLFLRVYLPFFSVTTTSFIALSVVSNFTLMRCERTFSMFTA